MSWWNDLLAGLGIRVPPLTWQPTYEPVQYVTTTMGDGSTSKSEVSKFYLATAETAEHLRAIYCPKGRVVLEPFLGQAGPSSGYPPMRMLEWPNGVRIIAGLLAEYFTEKPFDPVQADKDVRVAIAVRGAA